MKVTCKITLEFDSTKDVDTVIASTKVDDFEFVKSKRDGKKLVAKVESDSIPSILHTLDDYLACITVASKIVEKK